MTKLQGESGEVRMTISIVRKVTGKVETYELVGRQLEHGPALLEPRAKVHGAAGAIVGPASKVTQEEQP